MSVQIKINDEFLDLLPKTKIKYVFQSPAFGDNVIYGDFSHPVNFPATDKNKRILGHPERMDMHDSFEGEYEAGLYVDSIKIVSGKFKISKASKAKYQGNFISGMSYVKNYIEEKNINELGFSDIILGADETAAHVSMVNAVQGSYPDYEYVFAPVHNKDFFKDTSTESDFQDDTTVLGNRSLLNRYNGHKTTIPPSYAYWPSYIVYFSPQWYVKYVIDQIFNDIGINVGGSWYDDAELSTLMILSKTCTGGTAPLSINAANHLPEESIQKILIGLKKLFNLGFFYSQAGNKIYLTPLKNLLTSDVETWTDKLNSSELFIVDKNDGYTFEYNFDSNDEITSDYIQGFENVNIQPEVFFKYQLPSTGNTINDVRYVRTECAYYIWMVVENNPADWHLYTFDYNPLAIDGGEKDISTEVSPVIATMKHTCLWDDDKAGYYYDYIKCPVLKQVGNYLKNPTLWDNPFKMRLGFFRGLQKMRFGYKFPMISPDASGFYGPNFSTGNYSLKWHGSKGIYETWYKDWMLFLDNAKYFKTNILLNINDLLNLDLTKRKRIGNNNFLVKKVTVEFPIKKPAVVELVKINKTPDESSSSESGSSSSSFSYSTSQSASSPPGDFNNDFNQDFLT